MARTANAVSAKLPAILYTSSDLALSLQSYLCIPAAFGAEVHRMSASGGMQQAQCRTPPSLPPIRQRSASPIQTDMLWGADGLMSPVRVTPSRSISKFTNRPYVRGWAHALFVFLMAALIRRSFSGDKSAEHFYGGGRKGAAHLPSHFITQREAHHSCNRLAGQVVCFCGLVLQVRGWSHPAMQS